jgi:hypothetical protein
MTEESAYQLLKPSEIIADLLENIFRIRENSRGGDLPGGFCHAPAHGPRLGPVATVAGPGDGDHSHIGRPARAYDEVDQHGNWDFVVGKPRTQFGRGATYQRI